MPSLIHVVAKEKVVEYRKSQNFVITESINH
jgi:hypothetical protein